MTYITSVGPDFPDPGYPVQFQTPKSGEKCAGPEPDRMFNRYPIKPSISNFKALILTKVRKTNLPL